MADRDVSVRMTFEDEYTDGVKKADDATKDLDSSTEKMTEANLEANVQFMATLQGMERFNGGIRKTIQGLNDVGIISEKTRQDLKGVTGGLDVMTGTLQVAYVAMTAWTRATEAQKMAMVGLGAAAGAVGLAMVAMNATTEKQRVLFSLLTGVTAGLAVAQFTLALAEMSAKVAAAGPLAPIMAALIGGSIVAGATYIAATREQASAQTGLGEAKVVEARTTGNFTIHEGEEAVVRRISAAEAPAPGGPSVVVNNTFVGWFSPLDPRGQQRISEETARGIYQRLGGRT